MVIIKRISKIFALLVLYVVCAYGYLTAKGFVFTENGPILSNQAIAKEMEFSQKIDGDLALRSSQIREIGDKNAPLTMYGYSSMTCSHCKDFHNYIFPKIEKEFIATGKLRYIFVHFPIEPVSMKAAKLSYCLPEEKYYPFISGLYGKRNWQLSEDDGTLYKYAAEFGMTEVDIKNCEDDKRLTGDILQTRDAAIKDLGIRSTPSFIIEGKDGKELIVGAHSYDDFKEYLDKRLNEGSDGSDS